MTLEQAKEILETIPTTKKERELFLRALQIVAGSFVRVS